MGLLCAELCSRFVLPTAGSEFLFQAPENAPDGMYVNDKHLIYRPHPGFTAQARSPGYSVPIRINKFGLRGASIEKKTADRWLVMGDSFTFAAQVAEEDSFIGRLDEELPIEFLNGGADGYGTHQAHLRYKHLWSKLELDGLLIV